MDEVEQIISEMLAAKGYGRAHAARKLEDHKDLRAVAALNKVVADDKEFMPVQRAAAISLKKIGDSSSIPFLITALKGHWEVRAAALEALSNIADESSIGILISALKERKRRHDIVELLGKVKGREKAVPALIEALEDPDPVIRGLAIKSLFKTRVFSAVPSIAARLLDKNENVRVTAVENLFEFSNISAVPWLLKATSDRNIVVMHNAFVLLEGICKSCKTHEEIADYEKLIKDFLRERREKPDLAKPSPRVIMLMSVLAKRRDELASQRDIILGEIPKPPKRGTIYRQMERVRNG